MSLKHPKKKFFFNLRKRWLKFIPTKRKIIKSKYLKFISHRLHDRRLWRLDNHSVPVACGIGFFVAFIPIPFQMVLSVVIGLFLRANLLLCAALVWITNPITMGPIFYFCYRIGQWALGSAKVGLPKKLDPSNLFNQLHLIWQPFILGCFICAVIAGVGAYSVLRLYFLFYKTHLKHKHTQKLMHNNQNKPKK